MDDRTVAQHLDAVAAAEWSTRWVACVAGLLVLALLLARALRPGADGARRSPARRRTVVAGLALALVLGTVGTVVARRDAVARADDSAAAISAWLQSTHRLTTTGPGRGCLNDLPEPYADTCRVVPVRDDAGEHRQAMLRWYRLPDGTVDLQLDVDLPPPGP